MSDCETRKFVAARQVSASDRSKYRSFAAALRIPSVPVLRILRRLAPARPAASSMSNRLYGKSANFMVSFHATRDWLKDFAGFVENLSDRYLKTLVAQVHISVGQTVEVHPEKGLLEAVKKAGLNARGG